MDYEVGDIVKLKKQHPCGSKEWRILRTGVYGMLTSDHDTEKTSGEKYQGASQGGVGVVNVQMNEFSEGTFTCPSENLFICTCIFLEASTL
jgi:hypothetical protein